MDRAIAVGDIRRWIEGLDDSEEVSVDVMFPELGGSCGEVLEVLLGTYEVGHGPGMRIRVALPGSGDPTPRRRQALAVLEGEACRIPF